MPQQLTSSVFDYQTYKHSGKKIILLGISIDIAQRTITDWLMAEK